MGYPNGTVPTPPGVRVHPTPIYETLAMLVVFAILFRMARRRQPAWFVFGWYLVLTGVERLLVEFVRINPVVALGLTQPQWVAIGSIVLGAVIVYFVRGRAPVTMPATAGGGRAGDGGVKAEDGGGEEGGDAKAAGSGRPAEGSKAVADGETAEGGMPTAEDGATDVGAASGDAVAAEDHPAVRTTGDLRRRRCR